MNQSDIKPGYVYHIKDLYFDKAQDKMLMRNHEGDTYRPTYFCVKDERTGLLWVIPMSCKTEKYLCFMQKDIERYGKCLKIVIGEYASVNAVFLLQNMFPILPNYDISAIKTIVDNLNEALPHYKKIGQVSASKVSI